MPEGYKVTRTSSGMWIWVKAHSSRRSPHSLQASKKPKKRAPAGGNKHSSGPSKARSRYRNKDEPSVVVPLGRQQLVEASGAVHSEIVETHLSFPRIERMWDSTHKLVRPVLYRYRKGIYDRLHAVRGRAIHEEGGPMRKVVAWIRQAIQGEGTYFGRDFREFGGYLERYIGGFVPSSWPHGYTITDINTAGISGPYGPDFGSAQEYGAEAFARFKPKIADFDAMQGIGQNLFELPAQLRTTAKGMNDAFRSMVGQSFGSAAKGGLSSAGFRRSERRRALRSLVMPKNIANQFLNEQFGWAPFISDLKDLYKAYQRQSFRFRNIQERNGEWGGVGGTLRRTESVEEYTTVDNYSGYVYPVLTDQYYRSSGTWVTSHLYTEETSRIWFRGSMKFYAPEFDVTNRASEGMYGEIMRRVHYYGVRISPTVVWELTPWTWLVDWFSNAGAVIDNVTASILDRVVAKYAYVMKQTHREAVNDSTIHFRSGDVKCQWRQVIDVKQRNVAHPFGFSLDDTDLTVRQLAILFALGINRAG